MKNYTLLLEDGTVGRIYGIHPEDMEYAVFAKVRIMVRLSDENGVPVIGSGIVAEVLEEELG